MEEDFQIHSMKPSNTWNQTRISPSPKKRDYYRPVSYAMRSRDLSQGCQGFFNICKLTQCYVVSHFSHIWLFAIHDKSSGSLSMWFHGKTTGKQVYYSNVWGHTNKLENENYMIILSRFRETIWTYFNTDLWDSSGNEDRGKPTSTWWRSYMTTPIGNIFLNWETGGKLKAFPLRPATRQGFALPTIIQHSFEVLAMSIMEEKYKRNPNWKEVKLLAVSR